MRLVKVVEVFAGFCTMRRAVFIRNEAAELAAVSHQRKQLTIQRVSFFYLFFLLLLMQGNLFGNRFLSLFAHVRRRIGCVRMFIG